MCNVLIEYDRCSRWLMSLISHLRWSLRLYLPYLSAVWNSPVTVSLFHIISPFPLHHILFLFLSSFPVCWSISRVFVPLSACCESSDCHFQHLFLFSSSSRSFWLVCRFPPLLSSPPFRFSLHFFPYFPAASPCPCSFALPASTPSSFSSCHYWGFLLSLPLIWPFVAFLMWVSGLIPPLQSTYLSIFFPL